MGKTYRHEKEWGSKNFKSNQRKKQKGSRNKPLRYANESEEASLDEIDVKVIKTPEESP